MLESNVSHNRIKALEYTLWSREPAQHFVRSAANAKLPTAVCERTSVLQIIMGDKLVWALKNGNLEEVKTIVEVSITLSLYNCAQIMFKS